MNEVPLSAVLGFPAALMIIVGLLVQALLSILFSAIGAWLAIRFEKRREARA